LQPVKSPRIELIIFLILIALSIKWSAFIGSDASSESVRIGSCELTEMVAGIDELKQFNRIEGTFHVKEEVGEWMNLTKYGLSQVFHLSLRRRRSWLNDLLVFNAILFSPYLLSLNIFYK